MGQKTRQDNFVLVLIQFDSTSHEKVIALAFTW